MWAVARPRSAARLYLSLRREAEAVDSESPAEASQNRAGAAHVLESSKCAGGGESRPVPRRALDLPINKLGARSHLVIYSFDESYGMCLQEQVLNSF